ISPLRVAAAWTQAPRLAAPAGEVDPRDPHAPALGVEHRIRRELGQRDVRRPAVLVGARLVAAPLAIILFVAAPPDERLQRHALFREGIVGDQAAVGQELEQLALADAPDQVRQQPLLALEILDLLVPPLALGLGPLGLEALAHGLALVLQGPAPLQLALELIEDPPAQAAMRRAALDEGADPLPALGRKLAREQAEEILHDLRTML